MEDAPDPVPAAADVLPTGVRRRLGARDAWLASVLCGELLAGVLLGAVWEARDELGAVWTPAPSAAPAGHATGARPATGTSAVTAWVVVPPPPAPPAPPPPPLRTVPRNPFEVQAP